MKLQLIFLKVLDKYKKTAIIKLIKLPKAKETKTSLAVTKIWLNKFFSWYKSIKHFIILLGLEKIKVLIILKRESSSQTRKKSNAIRIWVMKIKIFLFFCFFKKLIWLIDM